MKTDIAENNIGAIYRAYFLQRGLNNERIGSVKYIV